MSANPLARARMALYFAGRAKQGVCPHAMRADMRLAVTYMVNAIRDANKGGGIDLSARASLFRMLNWLRADLRKMGRAA